MNQSALPPQSNKVKKMVKQFWLKGKERNSIYTVPFYILCISQSAQAWTTQFYLQNADTPCLPFLLQYTGDFYEEQCNATMISLEHCSWLQQSRCSAVTEECNIDKQFCCIYRSRDSHCFSVGQTTPKIARSHWGSWLLSNTWFSGLMQVSPHTASWSVQPFLTAHLCDKHTDRHTDHAACDICSNRPHLCSVYDVA